MALPSPLQAGIHESRSYEKHIPLAHRLFLHRERDWRQRLDRCALMAETENSLDDGYAYPHFKEKNCRTTSQILKMHLW